MALKINAAKDVCKLWLGSTAVWYQYLAYDYSDGTYSKTWKNYKKPIK